MKNKEKIQLLENRLNTHSELLERIISKLEFDDEPKLRHLDQSIFDVLDDKWKFAAIDGCTGRAYAYEYKPHFCYGSDYWSIREGNYKELPRPTKYYTSNCQDSLIERESKPQLKQLDQGVFIGLDSKWKYAAVDANGEANLYTHHIIPDSVEFAYCDAMDFDCQTIGTDYDATDWKNSRIKRETFELTGNELCKAMLARGDKYVLCLVNDKSEESAKSYERVRVICSRGCDYFDDTTEDMWYFAIPINNQGQPLTSSDVGL